MEQGRLAPPVKEEVNLRRRGGGVDNGALDMHGIEGRGRDPTIQLDYPA